MARRPEPKAADAQRVAFIAGTSWSGSTLLEQGLAQLDGWVSIGEPFWIWDRAFPLMLCECGTEFGRCEFWQTVLHEAYGNEQYAVREHVRVQARGLVAPLDPADPRALRCRAAVAGARRARRSRRAGLRDRRPAHRRDHGRRRVEVRAVGPRSRGRDPRRPARHPPRAGPGVVPRVRRAATRDPLSARRDPAAASRHAFAAHLAAAPLRGRPAVAPRHQQHDGALRGSRARPGPRPRVRWRGRSIPPRTWTACSTATGSSCAVRGTRSAATRADRAPVRRRSRTSTVPRTRTWRRSRVPS